MDNYRFAFKWKDGFLPVGHGWPVATIVAETEEQCWAHACDVWFPRRVSDAMEILKRDGEVVPVQLCSAK